MNEPKSAQEIANSLREQASQIEAEGRIQAALKLFGKEIPPGSTMIDAFNIISETLESLYVPKDLAANE